MTESSSYFITFSVIIQGNAIGVNQRIRDAQRQSSAAMYAGGNLCDAVGVHKVTSGYIVSCNAKLDLIFEVVGQFGAND